MKERSTGPGWGTWSSQGHRRRVPGKDAPEPYLSLLQVEMGWEGQSH